VAKRSKTEPEEKIVDGAESDSAAGNGGGTAEAKKKSRSTGKPKTKKPAARKTTTKTPRSASQKAPSPDALREPSDEEIRLRAYFIAERRIQLALPGDSAHDWIEARRQLIEEARSGT
jgi:hypothetical protein